MHLKFRRIRFWWNSQAWNKHFIKHVKGSPLDLWNEYQYKRERGINQSIDKFREKILVERKHERNHLYFAPIILNLNHPFHYKSLVLSPSFSVPNLINSIKIPLLHTCISLNHSLFLFQVYLFNFVSPLTGSSSRDIFSLTSLPFVLASYFRVQKVILLFKLTETVPFLAH